MPYLSTENASPVCPSSEAVDTVYLSPLWPARVSSVEGITPLLGLSAHAVTESRRGGQNMIHGLAERLTKSGIPVLRVHYSADPEKRPGTTAGDLWLAQATQGYAGGVNSPRWRKEMEIDYGALLGTMLFPLWSQWSTNGRIVIPAFDPIGYKIYGSYDHGWRHPGCYLVHGINPDGNMVTLWEMWASHVTYQDWAKVIKGERVTVPSCGSSCHPESRTFLGNPYAGREVYRVADSSIWAEDKPQADNTMKSMAKLYRGAGVTFIPGEKGGDTTVAEWLIGTYWKDPMQPQYRITTACPKLIWEIGRQRHKDVSDQVAVRKAQPEELVDKDNDAFDSLKYFLLKFPPTPQEAKAAQKPGSFAWWRKMSITPRAAGDPAPTYQRGML